MSNYVLTKDGQPNPVWLGDDPGQVAVSLSRLPDRTGYRFWHYPCGYDSVAKELPLPLPTTQVRRKISVTVALTVEVACTLGKYPTRNAVEKAAKALLPPGMPDHYIHVSQDCLGVEFIQETPNGGAAEDDRDR